MPITCAGNDMNINGNIHKMEAEAIELAAQNRSNLAIIDVSANSAFYPSVSIKYS